MGEIEMRPEQLMKLVMTLPVLLILLQTIPLAAAQISQSNPTIIGNNNMIKYSDPQNKFSFSYPSDWTVQPNHTPFGSLSTVAQFAPSNSLGDTKFSVVMDTNTSNTNPATSATNSISTLPVGYTIIRDTNCTDLQIGGQQACGYIVGSAANSTNGQPLATIQEGAFINGNMYVFTLTTNQNMFNSYVPVYQAMLASFRAPGQ